MKFYLTVVFLFVTFITSAQFSDDFEDGDFNVDPTWTGMDANFEVDELNQLHLVAPAEADTSYLSVFTTLIDDVTWDFWLNMDFNPSSGNNTRVYLVSDEENLKGSLNGYFVLLGNTDDEISLYRQTGESITEIIDGLDDATNSDNAEVRVRVTRDVAGNWELLRDTTGGYAFISEGTILDAMHTTTNYFGVFCKYTSSRSELFYFDNLGNPYVDAIPPTLESVTVISDTELDVLFSEPIDPVTGTVFSNYSVDGGIGIATGAIIDGVNPALVHLTTGTAFTNGETYELSVENVEDLDGNTIESPAVISFLYFVPEAAEANDVIITELLADPNPVIGLPELEFFEIYNRSDKIFDLADWTINDNTTTADFDTYILKPNEYVVICGEDEGVLFGIDNYLEVGGLPTLTNSDDDLVLKDNAGLEIDSIHYFVSWYADTDKDDGGWTLERKHLDSPCSDASNWGASTHTSGGTPGLQNSIWTDVDDFEPASILGVLVNSETEVIVTLSKALDTLVPPTLYLSPTVDVLSGYFLTLDTYQVNVFTLEENQIYTLGLFEMQDCWGNAWYDTIKFGLPGSIEPEDIILNEILFDPKTGGSDFVEVYNVSDKILDLNQLFLASWDEGIANFEQIGSEQYLLLPGQYATLTEDSTDIINDFSIYASGAFLDTELPTYPNDSGTVYLMRADTTIIDYFHYDDGYHFALLNTEDGKSLERITFGGGMNNPSNWHTASENVDWGTPGYLNSQAAMPVAIGDVSIDPQLFSPDNDGYNDVVTINFDLTDSDNVLDVTIYDNQGRLIRFLEDNYFMGQTGILVWDGINDDGEKAAIGSYIILISVKNTNGDETQFKLVTVLAGQL
ncbi:MAG: hypothetical protein GQ574_03330 [Crocinitomix sp.]|nr:hypothetical protein [Crocinitomix sp.]